MTFFAQDKLPYPAFKERLLKHTLLLGIIVSVGMLFVRPQWVWTYAIGVLMSVGYVHSLFVSAEHPMRHWSVVFALGRLVFVSFLIVLVGQFKLLETSVVFCGFLSYKIVLLGEYVRYGLGIKTRL